MFRVKQANKQKSINSTQRAMLVIVFVAIVLFVVLLVSGYRLQQKISLNESRMEELQDLIGSEEERTVEIENLQEYMQSDEYLEQEAKEQLGFVKEGEIILKESN